ncbi:hypothetical protein GY45DRAFT_1324905 [Cubamyces sp. BRFM 1775]|nr:hypothetical protein GY45DRAFT_1324905 [Cubamyces sp. BRFM 1775]
MSRSSNSSSESDSLEATVPVRIGAGSFATIYALPGRAVVFKVAHLQDHLAQIKHEYETLHNIYTLCNSDSIFAIPRALAFFDPSTQELLFHPPSPHQGRLRQARSPFNTTFFADLPPRACYVMDRVAPLPRSIAQLIRSSMYPPKASELRTPLLGRLYFGKELRPSAFVNTNNFPIDVARYRLLQDQFTDELSPIEEVAEGMGEMLSMIHWNAGYDARDVEFVLAGDIYSGAARLYIIDFNQTQSFNKSHDDVTSLVEAFFSNDPYYPRPIPGDQLYERFKQAYVRSCNLDHLSSANLFLRAIEDHQATTAMAS